MGKEKEPVHLHIYSSTFTCSLDTLHPDCTLFLTSRMHLSNAFYCWTQAFQLNLFNKVTEELQLTSENVLGCFSVTNCWLLAVLLRLVVESDVPNSKCAKCESLLWHKLVQNSEMGDEVSRHCHDRSGEKRADCCSVGEPGSQTASSQTMSKLWLAG